MPSRDVRLENKITARRVILTSFAVDFLDVVLNLSVSIISGSVVMLSQVLEAVADLSASAFLLIGLRRSMRREDKTHPFGYGREIYFWTLLSAIIMFGITATLSFYLGFQRFVSPHQIQSINLALAVLIVTFATNFYAFFLSFRRLLRKRPAKHIIQIFFRSSLVETKVTFILDLMGTVASLLGTVALTIYVVAGDLRFDGLGAMAIGIALAIFSIFLILGIRDLMIGRSASVETEKKIIEAALKVDEVNDVLDLKTLHVGSERLLVNLEVHMRQRLSTRELEKLIDKIKENIQKEVPTVKYLQVELEAPNR